MKRWIAVSWQDKITAMVMLMALVAITLMPFQDTSEPRYAEIARLMYSTGDWITPWFEPGKPFWGKPPLSFWAAAASMHVFGVNEFAARFPSWLSMLFSLLAIRFSIGRVYGSAVAQWTSLIYVSMVLVFVNIGAVLTDPFLALGTSLVFCSFLFCMSEDKEVLAQEAITCRERRVWAYMGFLGLAIGLLAKGPLTLVLVGAPVVVYLAWHRTRWQRFAHVYSWLPGILLVLVVVLPWYILAELKTPGFLNYFIVGEHFLRFVDPGWQGDLYGTAHQQAYGTIWLNALVAGLPWWPIAAIALIVLWRQGRLVKLGSRYKAMPMRSFVLSWALFCAVFFTFSGNILWTYLLPSMLGVALLMAPIMQNMGQGRWAKRLSYSALLAPSLLLVVITVGTFYPQLWRTEKHLVDFVRTQDNAELYYYKERPFSARFYSEEAVQFIDDASLQGKQQLADQIWFIAVNKRAMEQFKQVRPVSLYPVYENKRYYLFKHIPVLAKLKS